MTNENDWLDNPLVIPPPQWAGNKIRNAHDRIKALEQLNADMLAALEALSATARTFRNVPVSEQMWTHTDDEALDMAFAAIAKARNA